MSNRPRSIKDLYDQADRIKLGIAPRLSARSDDRRPAAGRPPTAKQIPLEPLPDMRRPTVSDVVSPTDQLKMAERGPVLRPPVKASTRSRPRRWR